MEQPTPREKFDYLGDKWSDIEDPSHLDTCFNEPKSLFVSMLLLLYLLITLLAIFSLYLVEPRLQQISTAFYSFIKITIITLLTVLWLDITHLVATALINKKIIFSRKNAVIPWQTLLPMVVILAGMLGISRDKISNSFFKFNNSLVKTRDFKKEKLLPEQVLVLLPRCIQNFECKQHVIADINNCKKCGKCNVKDILEISNRYGCHMFIVTGGSAARKMIKKLNPVVVVAVACERELLSGIQDVARLEILGIVNERPEGPCKNTKASMEELAGCLSKFLDPKQLV